MRYGIRLAMFLMGLLAVQECATAWDHIGHYAIGRAAGLSAEDSGNMNLPDIWKSYNWMYQITDEFCWSHAAQRCGTVGVGIPKVPRYPDDDREPGKIMYDIATTKVNWSDAEKNSAKKTARGFVGHNAMDNVVHYSYFRGGTLGNWTVQHKDKEEWAGYVIWVVKGNVTFGDDGKAATFWGMPVQAPNVVLIPLSCNAKIIRLAQEVARKNRRMMDYDEQSKKESNPYTTVETLAAINSRIESYRTAMTTSVKGMTEEQHLKLLQKAARNNWTRDEMWAKFDAAKANAQSLLALCPK